MSAPLPPGMYYMERVFDLSTITDDDAIIRLPYGMLMPGESAATYRILPLATK